MVNTYKKISKILIEAEGSLHSAVVHGLLACCCEPIILFSESILLMKNEELKMHQHSTVSTGQLGSGLGTAAAGKVLSNSQTSGNDAMFSKMCDSSRASLK